jgi:hypothetical protein
MVAFFSLVFSLIAVPVVAAGAVYGAFKIVEHSQPLQDAVLDWLTQRREDATLQLQYLLIRKGLFGPTALSAKRSVAILACFAIVFLFLLLAALSTPKNGKEGFLEVAVRFYALFYFHFWAASPFTAVGLLLVAFLLSHLSFTLFDLITLRIWAFGNSLVAYIALLIIGYALMISLVLFLSTFVPYILSPSEVPNDFWEFFRKAITSIPDALSELSKPHDADEWGDVVALGMLVAIVGTALICFSAMFAITGLNVLYAGALGFLKVDRFLREKYKWSQKHIIEHPVDYIAAVTAVLVCIITGAANLAWAISTRLLF